MTAAVLDLPAYLVLSDLDTITAVELTTRLADAQAAVVKAHAEGRRYDATEAKRSIRSLEGETRRRAVPAPVAA